MPTKRYVRTPLGEFPTIAAASAAHRCDRHTLTKRIKDRPEEYQYVEVAARKKPAYEITVRGARWPISWTQNKVQEYDIKEQIYLAWCQRQDLDPDTEHAANAFFDEMDQYVAPQEEEEQDEITD